MPYHYSYNIIIQVGSLFTSGLLYIFTQVKVIDVCLTEWFSHLKKIILLTEKCYYEVGNIIAINCLPKLAVSSIEHLEANRG